MKITNYKIVLASNSPRRQELLTGLDVDYEVRVINDIDESYPEDIPLEGIAEFLAKKKANAYHENLLEGELLITADTIVLKNGVIYGKPTDKEDAYLMLSELSGGTHLVITGVCLSTVDKEISFSSITKVTFGFLEQNVIEYYVEKYKPFDKAGAYGIQEWIGYVGVKSIEGSYYNVMGLPINRVCEELKNF